jgi:hypothetical protein
MCCITERGRIVRRSITLEERVHLLKEQCMEAQKTLEGQAVEAIGMKAGIRALKDDAKVIQEVKGQFLERLTAPWYRTIQSQCLTESKLLFSLHRGEN